MARVRRPCPSRCVPAAVADVRLMPPPPHKTLDNQGPGWYTASNPPCPFEGRAQGRSSPAGAAAFALRMAYEQRPHHYTTRARR